MQYRAYRYPCDHPVTVWLRDRPLTARLVNVSASGARLSGVEGADTGDILRVQPGPGCAPCMAEVRWARGAVLGLRFAVPLDARSLALIRKSVGHRALAPVKPGGWTGQLPR